MSIHNLYLNILNEYENTYFSEDEDKIIIGINCRMINNKNYSLEDVDNIVMNNNSSFEYDGLFGVMGYNLVNKFEDISLTKNKNYDFYDFIFAKAKSYIYFDKKNNKINYINCNESDFGNDDILSSLNDDFAATIINNLEEEEKDFYAMIDNAKEYIKSGDIFQVVLSKQLMLKSSVNPFLYYLKLSVNNKSPYMFYFPTDKGIVLGSSPEILVSKVDDEIKISPIAGTRKVSGNKIKDRISEEDLLNDQKEISEHKMLVDLARNDVSVFAKPGSVKVENPIHIKYFESVMHIVSDVHAKVDKNISPISIIKHAFPAGTLSGAPKIRAMEIINEQEDLQRGIYGGAIGFLYFNNNVETAIIIRSAFVKDETYYIQSGAGIVIDSKNELEYKEINNKRNSLTKLFNIRGDNDINNR